MFFQNSSIDLGERAIQIIGNCLVSADFFSWDYMFHVDS